MDHYLKTDLGIQALKQRSFQLNARQRQLLLLIGTDDFKILNSDLKQRLATPELIQQLEQLGLIFAHLHHKEIAKVKVITFTNQSEIILKPANKENSKITQQEAHLEDLKPEQQQDFISAVLPVERQSIEEIQGNLTSLTVNEVKQMMMSLLQNYCGLMGKQLIQKIQQANSVREIKLCQMQWITTLQETRIPPHELNQTMQKINYALHCLQTT